MQQNTESSGVSSSTSPLTNSSHTNANDSTISEHIILNENNNNASYRRTSTLNNPASNPSTSSNASTTTLTTTFQQIRVNIKCARFTPNGGLFNTKGDIYVEMIIDGNPSRKTEIAKKTWSPVWNENFDILITPVSRMQNKSKFLNFKSSFLFILF